MGRPDPQSEDAVELARDAARRGAWADAHARLARADREDPLDVSGLELLATAARLAGKDDESIVALVRAHEAALAEQQVERAARHAGRLAMLLGSRGDLAQASGWILRAQSLLRDRPDAPAHGYVLVPAGIQALDSGDIDIAEARFGAAMAIADRARDRDLGALARLGLGDALVLRGERDRGIALLDEAMVAVTSGEVSPEVVGIVYCGVIDTCQRLFDVRRAQEWTEALSRWVENQPQLVPYRGQCLLYRTQLLMLHGTWREAAAEAELARDRLVGPPPDPALGDAWYQQAEVARLRGDAELAESAYREASRHGRRPEPGLPLLRLDQGRAGAAVAAIQRALDEIHDPLGRPAVLEGWVEIALATGDRAAARVAADELQEIAEVIGAPILQAIAAGADGAVQLADGNPRGALPGLRRAWTTWSELRAPYAAARVRVLIGVACREVGDEETARLELEAAREAFEALGARPAIDALARIARPSVRPGGLSAREVEVLRHIAAGRTNREIAHELGISEKTVARHVSNILTKLDRTSRAAATAYAYEHDLVQ